MVGLFQENDLVVIKEKYLKTSPFGYVFRVTQDNYNMKGWISLHPMGDAFPDFDDGETFSHQADYYELINPEHHLAKMPDEWLKELLKNMPYEEFKEQYLKEVETN